MARREAMILAHKIFENTTKTFSVCLKTAWKITKAKKNYDLNIWTNYGKTRIYFSDKTYLDLTNEENRELKYIKPFNPKIDTLYNGKKSIYEIEYIKYETYVSNTVNAFLLDLTPTTKSTLNHWASDYAQTVLYFYSEGLSDIGDLSKAGTLIMKIITKTMTTEQLKQFNANMKAGIKTSKSWRKATV